MHKYATTFIPKELRCDAAIKPSFPLLPFPTKTIIVVEDIFLISLIIFSAIFKPAFSINFFAVIPSFSESASI